MMSSPTGPCLLATGVVQDRRTGRWFTFMEATFLAHPERSARWVIDGSHETQAEAEAEAVVVAESIRNGSFVPHFVDGEPT